MDPWQDEQFLAECWLSMQLQCYKGGIRCRPVTHLPLQSLQEVHRAFELHSASFTKWWLWNFFAGWEQTFQKFLATVHARTIDSRGATWQLKVCNFNGYVISLARKLSVTADFWVEKCAGKSVQLATLSKQPFCVQCASCCIPP